jgi:hypothetical protein
LQPIASKSVEVDFGEETDSEVCLFARVSVRGRRNARRPDVRLELFASPIASAPKNPSLDCRQRRRNSTPVMVKDQKCQTLARLFGVTSVTP